MMPHFVGKIAQKAVVVQHGKVLLVRDGPTELWELPGGRINAGEDPEAAICRELHEEIGILVGSPILFYLGRGAQIREPDMPHMYVGYEVELLRSVVIRLDMNEINDLVWVGSDWAENYKVYPVIGDMLRAWFARRQS